MPPTSLIRPQDWTRSLRRRVRISDGPVVIGLVVLVAVTTTVALFTPTAMPFTGVLFPMILASLWLAPRAVPWFVALVSLSAVVVLVTQGETGLRALSRLAVTALLAGLILNAARRRTRLGVSAPRGESMFVDLRDRISRQGDIPTLPERWYVDSAIRSAGGTQFAGDFVVASRTDADHLELVVVDVSGKGVGAGSRALFLSGALNGIVSALPGDRFLPAANDYLIQQEWAEGFATAIHLHLDLATGAFEIRKAGHPPAIWLQAGSGRGATLDCQGPALGLLPGAEFEARSGVLVPGDGLLLFTDGLVESPGRDLTVGIDRLTGLGEGLLHKGFDGGAGGLLDALGAHDDDRALVVVHRRWDS